MRYVVDRNKLIVDSDTVTISRQILCEVCCDYTRIENAANILSHCVSGGDGCLGHVAALLNRIKTDCIYQFLYLPITDVRWCEDRRRFDPFQ